MITSSTIRMPASLRSENDRLHFGTSDWDQIGITDHLHRNKQMLACRYQLVMGSLAVLRCHLTDSFYSVRKAIEYCAFAGRVKKHPHLAMVWLNAATDEKTYKDYREKFSPGKLFPQDDAILGQLSKRYDQCSKMAHPSIFSLSRHITVHSTEKIFNIDFGYFDIKPKDPSEPFRTFLWIVDTHFGIVRVFERLFSEAIAQTKQQWVGQRNAVDQKVGVYKAQWRFRIMPLTCPRFLYQS